MDIKTCLIWELSRQRSVSNSSICPHQQSLLPVLKNGRHGYSYHLHLRQSVNQPNSPSRRQQTGGWAVSLNWVWTYEPATDTGHYCNSPRWVLWAKLRPTNTGHQVKNRVVMGTAGIWMKWHNSQINKLNKKLNNPEGGWKNKSINP